MNDLSNPLSYFAKRAKELQTTAQAGDHAALVRIRDVFNDASGKSDHEVATEARLMRCQHVVAVEHGFANWKALADSSGMEARLAITMAKHPELNDFGIGMLSNGRGLSAEERTAKNAESRRILRASAVAVEHTVTWLQENVEPIRTVNRRHTSYGIKHIVEKDIGYITNGVMIAAGIIAQYPYEFVADSSNVLFGMSEKSLKDVKTRRLSPERVLKRFMPLATEVLAKRGIEVFSVGRSGVELTWLDDGDVRTLRIGTIETTPFIVRLSVDHFTIFVSRRAGKALGIETRFDYAKACPSRPKGELSVLPEEVDAALRWALNYDARVGGQPPPFELEGDGWSYVWSKRASERYAARPQGAVPR